MILLQLGKHEILFPETWNELTDKQLMAYARLLYPHRKKLFTIDGEKIQENDAYAGLWREVQFGLLFEFLGITWDEYTAIDNEAIRYLIDDEKLLQFLVLQYDLVENLTPKIEIDNLTLCGPTHLSNLSFEEFSIADGHYLQFARTGDVAALNSFIACLYRSERENWKMDDANATNDCRQPFNAFVVKYREELIAQVADEVKIAALIWYECARDLMVSNNEVVFKEGGSSQEEHTLAEIILSIGNGIERFDLVRKSSVMLVMADLKRCVLEAKKLRKQKTPA